jgi:hypothetical protein
MPKNLIEVAVIKCLVDVSLQGRKLVIIAHEAVVVQLCPGKLDHNSIVVAMQAGTLMIGGQSCQLVRGREVEFLGDAKHHAAPF